MVGLFGIAGDDLAVFSVCGLIYSADDVSHFLQRLRHQGGYAVHLQTLLLLLATGLFRFDALQFIGDGLLEMGLRKLRFVAGLCG